MYILTVTAHNLIKKIIQIPKIRSYF